MLKLESQNGKLKIISVLKAELSCCFDQMSSFSVMVSVWVQVWPHSIATFTARTRMEPRWRTGYAADSKGKSRYHNTRYNIRDTVPVVRMPVLFLTEMRVCTGPAHWRTVPQMPVPFIGAWGHGRSAPPPAGGTVSSHGRWPACTGELAGTRGNITACGDLVLPAGSDAISRHVAEVRLKCFFFYCELKKSWWFLTSPSTCINI